MTGFITTTEIASQIMAAIEAASEREGSAIPFGLDAVAFVAGHPHEGEVFIPFGDAQLGTAIRRGKTITEYPEFASLSALLGGLDARVEVRVEQLVMPAEQPI